MTLISKEQFKIEISASATALTEAWADSEFEGVANELSDPRHPLRRLEKLITMDNNGQFAPNTEFIDLAYEGKNPSVGTTLDKVAQKTDAPPYLFTRVLRYSSEIPINGEVNCNAPNGQLGPLNQFSFSVNDADGNSQLTILQNEFNLNLFRWVDTSNPANFVELVFNGAAAPPQYIGSPSPNVSFDFPLGNPDDGTLIGFIAVE